MKSEKLSHKELLTFRRVIALSSDIIIGVNKQYDCLFSSKGFAQYFRRSKAVVPGCPLPELVGKERFESEVKPHIDRAFRGREETCEIVFPHPRLGDRFLHMKFYQVKGNHYAENIAVGLARDVSRFEQRIRQLLQRQETNRILTEKAPDILLLMDAGGVIHLCSRQLDRETGLISRDILGQNVMNILTPDSRNKVIRHLEEWRHPGRRRRRWVAEVVGKGTVVPFEVNSTPVYERGELKWVVIIARNVSGLRQKELRQSRLYQRIKRVLAQRS
jgi:PAS domain S-box-containing protein